MVEVAAKIKVNLAGYSESDAIWIAGRRISFLLDENLWNDSGNVGEYRTRRGEICLDTSHSNDQKIILHELAEAVINGLDISSEISHSVMSVFVAGLAEVLSQLGIQLSLK